MLWRACEARSVELQRLEDEAAATAAAAAAASPAVQERGQAALPSPRGMLGSGAGGVADCAPNGMSSVSLGGGGMAGGGGLNVMSEWSSPGGASGGGGGRGDGDESEDSDVDINVEGGDTDTGTGDNGGKEGLTAESMESSRRGDADGAEIEARSAGSPAVVEADGGSSRDVEEGTVNCNDGGTEGRNEKAVLAGNEAVTQHEKMDEGEASVTSNGAAVVASEENSGHGTDGTVTVRGGDGKVSGEADERLEHKVEAPSEAPEIRHETQGGVNGEGIGGVSSNSSSRDKSDSCENEKKDVLVQGLPNDGSTPAETADNTVAAPAEGQEAGRGAELEVESGEVVNVVGEAGNHGVSGRDEQC